MNGSRLPSPQLHFTLAAAHGRQRGGREPVTPTLLRSPLGSQLSSVLSCLLPGAGRSLPQATPPYPLGQGVSALSEAMLGAAVTTQRARCP